MRKSALLIVDVQNDFCPGGALAVPSGDLVVEPLKMFAEVCARVGMVVLASRDWHPQHTSHFIESGGTWPPHCIQNSHGAAFHPALLLPEGSLVISKGTELDSDAYSAFDGHTEDNETLQAILNKLQVTHLYIGGLATDYCVLATVLDARNRELEVTLLTDAMAGVDVSVGDSGKALEKMRIAGAVVCTSVEAAQRISDCGCK